VGVDGAGEGVGAGREAGLCTSMVWGCVAVSEGAVGFDTVQTRAGGVDNGAGCCTTGDVGGEGGLKCVAGEGVMVIVGCTCA
jgi:hypothetical protein